MGTFGTKDFARSGASTSEGQSIYSSESCALFQCLWNSCWWSDSPESWLHYYSLISKDDPVPEKTSIPALHAVMEKWRGEKQKKSPQFPWLRLVRPSQATRGEKRSLQLYGHTDSIKCLAISNDGAFLASGSDDGTARVWTLSTGDLVAIARAGITRGVRSVAFSSDGTRLLTGSWDWKVKMWRARSGEMILEKETDPANTVYAVAFDKDDETFYAVWGTHLGCWDHSGNELWRIALRDVQFPAVFSLGADQLAYQSWSEDLRYHIRVVNVKEQVETGCIPGHGDLMLGLAFSTDGGRIASTSDHNTIRIWDLSRAMAPIFCTGHEGWTRSVAWSADGNRIVSCSSDETIRIWSADTGAEEERLAVAPTTWQIAFSIDGTVVYAGNSEDIWLWRPDVKIEPRSRFDHFSEIKDVEFSPDGLHVVTAAFEDSRA